MLNVRMLRSLQLLAIHVATLDRLVWKSLTQRNTAKVKDSLQPVVQVYHDSTQSAAGKSSAAPQGAQMTMGPIQWGDFAKSTKLCGLETFRPDRLVLLECSHQILLK
jgi:hypothetical protein